ncbi:MAG TPA: hypothetical protein VHX88_07430 [Solirubrobacteraceae bacterium]|jgi:hypothetical protein|nr:hypothetical protein [Solirubrobacteraceae bacterium]
MDRAAFRATLAERHADAPIVVAMLERHAARLEQLPLAVTQRDPEALARALRSVQRLYRLAALTVGDGGHALLRAVRSCADADDAAGALSATDLAAPLDGFERLRAVLREQVALVVVLPAVARLVGEAGMPQTAASALLIETIRTFGAREPDAFILTGHDGEPDPTHDTLGDFFGAPVLRVGPWASPGVALRTDLEPSAHEPEHPYLIATPTEVRADLAPADITSRLAAVATIGETANETA